MKLTVAPESSAALTADGTIRCLLDMRYPLPSRQSSAAIAFARQFADELARAVPAHLGPPPEAPEIRRQVDESLAQPIHVILIHESGDGYRIRRSPALDSRVAQRYAVIREQDRGPRPYFADNLNPPLYVDGIRFEGSLDELEAGGLGVPGEEWEEWEVKEVCGHRTADDGVLEVLVRWMSGKETWELYEDVAQSEAEAFDGYERVHGWVIGNTV
jgi:hypothetical protein